MSEDPLALAASLVKRALAEGADAAEAIVFETRATTMSAEGPYMRPSEQASEAIGMRVLVGGRMGIAGRRGLDRAEPLAAAAVRAARDAGTPAAGGFAPPLARQPPSFADPDVGDATRLSELVERASLSLRSISDVTYARVAAQDTTRKLSIANSLGLEATHVATAERFEVETRVTRGTTERAGADMWLGPGPAERRISPEAFAQAAAADARRALDPQPLPGAVDRVVLAPQAASQMLAIVSTSFSGIGLQAGKSAWEGRVGERVLSPAITMVDDARSEDGRTRFALDDEGTPTRRLALVEDGVLRSFVHTRASAAAMDVEPTGSAHRKGVDTPAIARCTNLAIQPGTATLEDLVAREERAVLVTQPLMGAFVASRVTGDFSLVAPFAFYVENGRIRHALPPTSIGGNAHRVLASADEVADDARTCLGGRTPSLRAGGVSCAT